MALSSSALHSLALTMGLAAADAVALPTVVDACARKSGLTTADIVDEAMSNAPLRDYMAGICRHAIAEVGA